MNKTLSVMLAAGLLVSGVAGAAEKPAVAFTPEQEARIGEIAKDYLLAHPEVLVEGAAWKTESMVTPVFATPILTINWLA
ncbi:hypothetical protein [Enterobacter kobei]|uniref:hypothetical protein n=1 Tax=Enterobacter kobei TaxID=208224 RepID=UPI003B215974